MRNIFIVLFLLIVHLSFGQSKHKSVKHKTPTKKAVSTKAAPKTKPKTTNSLNTSVVLSENTIDFGYINEGDAVKQRVYIRNTGAKPLQISDISAPCVSADYNFEPIAPGQTAYIDVSFSTKGKVGEQYKEVLIKGNIENKEVAIIYIKGVVYPK